MADPRLEDVLASIATGCPDPTDEPGPHRALFTVKEIQ